VNVYVTVSFLQRFWQQNPALLYGLSLLLGVSLAINGDVFLLIPIVFIFWNRRAFLVFLLVIGSFCYCKFTYQFPYETTTGTAHIKLQSLSKIKKLFGTQWIYRGKVLSFITKEGTSIAKNIPCQITVYQKKNTIRPPADRSYLVEGDLKMVSRSFFIFTPNRDKPWHPIKGSWSSAETRFKAKQTISRYIHKHIQDTHSAQFLAGLATGSFNDRQMLYEFSRYGLQHIMAISGFHFAIIASIITLFIRSVVSTKLTSWFLILALSSYFVFLGSSPSIMRAWIAIMITLFGYLAERRFSSLNSLGVAIMAIILMDPLMSQHIGFQFSVITTASILLFYPVMNVVMQKIFTKRTLGQMVLMNHLNQHAYFLLSLLRQTLALAIAVNLVAMPMMLVYFQKFPLLSFLYNLFFPFLVSVSMLLLILGFLFPPFNAINNIYTKNMLNFIYNMPLSLDYTLRVPEFSPGVLILYLSMIMFMGIYLNDAIRKQHQDLYTFAFI